MVNLEHRDAVIAQLQQAKYPSGSLNKDEAWLGILQVIPWFHSSGSFNVIDGNLLTPGARGFSKTWVNRAAAIVTFLEEQLGMSPGEFKEKAGLLWNHPFWQSCVSPQQKANPAGNALRYIGAHLLQLFGNARLEYREEQALSTYLPGIHIAAIPNPAADVLVVEHVGSRPVGLVSCKWSMRTDRVSETQRECNGVKAAAFRAFGGIRFYLLCHEYGQSRIKTMLKDPCVDALVLVNYDVLEGLDLLTSDLSKEREGGRLLRLAEFIDLTRSW
ncbi:MAG: hypothetical protein ACYDCC_15265 [Actinomycetota bacterium]